MDDIEKNVSWIEQLEVTGPIKSIMGFVDELSLNYDRRLKTIQADYQKDIEEMIACYKNEKQEFQNLLQQQQDILEKQQIHFESLLQQKQDVIEKQQKDFKNLQQNYNILNVEHKILQDCSETTKAELAMLTKELQSEEELVKLTQERIRTANEQIKAEMEEKVDLQVKISKTREFFKLIMESRVSQQLFSGHKEKAKEQEKPQDSSFSY